ncbi:hypothetical protein BKA70DRAFT_1327042 [Coprinopsis sp. MPI-PUGE-AT-0042]|nr:hypothetical protein BKA70DRAFT_1327042 [Coprinopsis sp. MPI-PUGE-AT-0042]
MANPCGLTACPLAVFVPSLTVVHFGGSKDDFRHCPSHSTRPQRWASPSRHQPPRPVSGSLAAGYHVCPAPSAAPCNSTVRPCAILSAHATSSTWLVQMIQFVHMWLVAGAFFLISCQVGEDVL